MEGESGVVGGKEGNGRLREKERERENKGWNYRMLDY